MAYSLYFESKLGQLAVLSNATYDDCMMCMRQKLAESLKTSRYRIARQGSNYAVIENLGSGERASYIVA